MKLYKSKIIRKIKKIKNYKKRLMQALRSSREIIEHSVSYLMTEDYEQANVFNIDDVRIKDAHGSKQNRLPYIQFDANESEKKLVLYNPSMQQRDELISVRVSNPNVQVSDERGNLLESTQVSLVWPNTDGGELSELSSDNRLPNNEDLSFATQFDSDSYELLFYAKLKPLSLSTYTITKKPENKWQQESLTKVTYYQSNLSKEKLNDLNSKLSRKLTEINKNLNDIISVGSAGTREADDDDINNMIRIKIDDNYNALFSPHTGFIRKLVSDLGAVKLDVRFVKYGTTNANEKSGAYLFLPDGPGVELNYDGLLRWIRVEHGGALRSRVCVNMTLLLHCIEVYPTMNKIKNLKYPLVSVWNVIDLRHSHNFELAMLINTDIKNDNYIHTDLNGFQFIKRRSYSKIPLQGNVYPMPSAAFIQDSKLRLNVLSAQPAGVASLQPSSFQIFMDRRLDQDDNRGMEEAMVSFHFFILN
jgi:alpha-mannosidase II